MPVGYLSFIQSFLRCVGTIQQVPGWQDVRKKKIEAQTNTWKHWTNEVVFYIQASTICKHSMWTQNHLQGSLIRTVLQNGSQNFTQAHSYFHKMPYNTNCQDDIRHTVLSLIEPQLLVAVHPCFLKNMEAKIPLKFLRINCAKYISTSRVSVNVIYLLCTKLNPILESTADGPK